jgi:hypothetical protein
MFGRTAFRVGTMQENALDVFVIKQSRTINELVEHPRRQEVLARFRQRFAH